MPDEFSDDEWERLRRLVARDDLDESQLRYACKTVYGWCHADTTDRRHWKVDWVLAVMNAIRAGWALKGY